jgi:hypothetical protein
MDTPIEKSRAGRLVVIGIFALLLGYAFVAVVGSMLKDLYADPPPAATSGLTHQERQWCTRRIQGLKNELESRATQFLQKPEPALFPRWEKWHTAWKEQLVEARSHCSGQDASLSGAYERLEEVHTLYANAVEGVMRARTELNRELDDLLNRL